MKVGELIARVDELKPNQIDRRLKIDWLKEIDMRIMNDVLLTHEGYEREVDDEGHPVPMWYEGEGNDMDVLLAEDPYSRLYQYWLYSNIDETNMELDKFNNSNLLFNKAYSEYAAYYNRKHIHKSMKYRGY